MFNDFKQNRNRTDLTDIQRAAMFYYLVKTSYGAKLEQYGANYRSPYLFLQDIEAISKRLSRVVIDNTYCKNMTNKVRYFIVTRLIIKWKKCMIWAVVVLGKNSIYC